MHLHERIKNLREAKNFTQRELANKIQVSYSVMNRIESGERPVRDIELIAIAQAFEVTTDYLLGLTDNSSIYPEPEVLAAHRTDDWETELPEEARKSLESFKEYLIKKHSNNSKD